MMLRKKLQELIDAMTPEKIKELHRALTPEEEKEKKKEEKAPTAAGTRQKQGEGFWQGDVIPPEPKKPEHYKKGNPKKINVGF